MFSRIRHASAVLFPPKPDPYEHPDIVFEEETEEVNKISWKIGTVIEVFILSITVGTVTASAIFRLFPTKPTTNVAATAATLATLLGIMFNYVLHKINDSLRQKLRIGTLIAPYVGHRLTRTIKILRG